MEAIRQRIDTVAREAAQWTGAGLQLNASATQIDEDQVSRAERRQLERDKAKAKAKQKGNNPNPRGNGQQPNQQPMASESCQGCGRRHKTVDCKLIEGKHPDANTSGESWATSQKGKAWKAAGFDFCQFERRIDGSAHAFALSKPKGFGGASSNKFDKHGANSKGKSCSLTS